ncbi:MAG: SIS domain-containing protein [Lachnospiraceae bacterium]|nr:SIS domain-containing protein [Lachnospiraceae bacterium]
MDILAIGKEVIHKETEAMRLVFEQLDETFVKIVQEVLHCTGKVIWIGMGKSGHVAKKCAATMSSLGISSIALHPAECMHGDLGMIQEKDLVIALSYSGESGEIIALLPYVRMRGVKVIGFTCNAQSTMAKRCTLVQSFDGIEEACHLGLAPTSSTTIMMAYGDAISVAASRMIGFDKNDFAKFHPSGALGRRLTLRTVDVMVPMTRTAVLPEGAIMSQAVFCFLELKQNMIPVLTEENHLVGVLKRETLEKLLLEGTTADSVIENSLLDRFPVYVDADTMAYEAEQTMLEAGVSEALVLREGKVVGLIVKNV